MNMTLSKDTERLTILFLSWRDINAPRKGGAELFTHYMMAGSDHSRLRLIHFSPFFPGAAEDETIDGIRYIRSGNLMSVISSARNFYSANADCIDYVVDQCNTHRFFTPLWVPRNKRIFFIHQLTREIWFTESRFPLNVLGHMAETPLLRMNKHDRCLTVSQSTRSDLISVGFQSQKISVIPEGLNFTPWDRRDFLPKEEYPTLIFVGRYTRYKGIEDSIRALALLKENEPEARLWIVGKKNESYIKETLRPLCLDNNLTCGSPEENPDVVFWGFVSEEKKFELMSRSHLLVFPSIREGWGLIISEAAAVGTPSLVYDAPGTRDAVYGGEAGFICKTRTPEALSQRVQEILGAKIFYESMRIIAWNRAKELQWSKTAQAFDAFTSDLPSNLPKEVRYA